MLGLLVESMGNVDQALLMAKKHNAKDLREAYDLIDEDGACAYMNVPLAQEFESLLL